MSTYCHTTTILRPQKYISRKSDFHEGDYYFFTRILDNGCEEKVYLTSQQIKQWDEILWVTIELREAYDFYTKSDPPKFIHIRSRFEVVGYVTFKQIRNMMSSQIELDLIPIEPDIKNSSPEIIAELKLKISELEDTKNRILTDSDDIFIAYYNYSNLLERRILFEQKSQEYQTPLFDHNSHFEDWLEGTDRYFKSVNFGSDKSNLFNEEGKRIPNPDMYKNYFLTKELLEYGLKIKNEPSQYESEIEHDDEQSWDD
jgi:hypothetical protein